MNKLLDLRFVIGAFFLIVGILLLGYSFANADGSTINRWCGIVFAIFGALMVVLSFGKDAADELVEREGMSDV